MSETQSTTATPGEDRELTAIQQLISALTVLTAEERRRVVDYVFSRLGLSVVPRIDEVPALVSDAGTAPVAPSAPAPAGNISAEHIQTLKDQKQPGSAVEMAVLVAYYLSEAVPPSMRKKSIGTAEITNYFKQAKYPLPSNPRMVLFKAKNAGYFDSHKQGHYTLNPVGHNLVVHHLPSRSKGAKSKSD